MISEAGFEAYLHRMLKILTIRRTYNSGYSSIALINCYANRSRDEKELLSIVLQ